MINLKKIEQNSDPHIHGSLMDKHKRPNRRCAEYTKSHQQLHFNGKQTFKKRFKITSSE